MLHYLKPPQKGDVEGIPVRIKWGSVKHKYASWAQACSSYKHVDLVGDAGDMLHHFNNSDMLHQLKTPQRVDVG